MSNKHQATGSQNTSDSMNSGADGMLGNSNSFSFDAYNSVAPLSAAGMSSAASQSFPASAQPAFQPIPASFGVFSAVTPVTTAAPPAVTAPTTVASTPTPVATVSTKATLMPSWVSTLQTASIAADMAAADVNGTVTYAGLDTLLTDLDSKLSSSKTALTAAELSDLKTITANLNNGMTTSAYLTNIMKSLVNGNAANAAWTGGAATSTALGNLAVGSSATQLSDLIGKWVLGTDLPSSKVSMEGSNFSVSYSASSKPLFAASGPSMSDINQGDLGDCYLLSSLAEVADQNSGMISSMITSNGNNTYGVRFYINGVAEYVTVNNSLANGGSAFNSGADIWASLVEKAYVQLQASGVVTGGYVNSGNSWSTIGNGGAPEFALEEITGASQITDLMAAGTSWYNITYNSSLSFTGYSINTTAAAISAMACDLAKGDDLILSSYTNATSGGKTTLVADHAMSIYGFDSVTGMFEIRNPWGTAAGQTWDTTFEVSLSTLLADGDTITIDNVGKTVAAPVLTAQTAAQTWKLGQAVSFTLASGTFTDPQGSALTYSAALSNGAALPSWLSFNSKTGTFTGTVANTTTGLSIKVTATDTSGLSTSEIFAVATPAAAPTVTAQTATQTWNTNQSVNFALVSNTFTDPQKETLAYTATQANGTALPAWLKFNGTTDTFSGTAPATTTSLSLKVTATDTSGLSVSETFTAAVAQLTQAISSLTSGSGSASSAITQLASATQPTLVSPAH
jgi:hypothetical protein